MSTSVVQVLFRGIEEGADPKNVPPGTLKAAHNLQMDKSARVLKRCGTSWYSKSVLTGGTLGEGLRLQTRGKDIIMPSGDYSCAYSSALGKFQLTGRPPTLRATRRGFVDSSRSAISTDVALYDNQFLVSITLSSYATPAGKTQKGSLLHLTIEDIETGTKLLPPLFLKEYVAWARLSVLGDWAFVSCSGINGTIYVHRLNLLTWKTTGVATVVDNFVDNSAPECTPSDSSLAIHPTEGVPYAYITWVPSGTDKLKVSKLRVSDFGNFSTISLLPGSVVVPQSVSIAATTAGIYVMAGSSNPSLCNLYKLDASTLATTVGPVTQTPSSVKFCSVQDYDTNNVLVMTTGADPANSTPHKLYSYLAPKTTLVKTATTQRITWHALAMTKAWKLNFRWYTLVTLMPKTLGITNNDPIPNASSVIVEIETTDSSLTSVTDSPHPHMGTAESMTGWFPTRIGYVPQAITRTVGSETKVYVPAAYRNREPMNFQSIPIGWNLYTIESNAKDTHRLAALGNGALAAAAAPYWLDGASCRPYGFAVAPMILALVADTSGSMAVGTYTYLAFFEWRDANAVLHRSPASPPLSVPVSASGRVRIDVTTASLSQHQGPPYTVSGGSGDPNAACGNPVSIALYRTTANGSNFYRLTLEPEFQMLVSSPILSTVSVYDTKADSDIGGGSPARPLSTQPYPYTGLSGTGGELDDIAPPSLLTVVRHGGRFVGIGPDKRTLWFSKDSTEDPTVAPGFNEVLTLGFGDDKNALFSLDEKLIVLGENGIDIVYGKGPDASGANSDWQIQRVQTDVGCINPRSIAPTPEGVFFESTRGLEFMTRELGVRWLGKSVEDTLATYPTITSAVTCPEAHEVRFTCNSATNGIVLAYDYANKCWFTRSYKDTIDSGVADVKLADAALIDGVYHLMTGNGQIYAETTAHKLDGGTSYVETELQLAPMSFGVDNLEEQRVKDMSVQGTSRSKHKLEISQRRDYATTWETPVKVFDENSPVTAVGPLETCRRTFPHQKCRSMEVRLRELAPTNPIDYGTGEGVILEGLAFQVQTKRGLGGTSKDQQG